MQRLRKALVQQLAHNALSLLVSQLGLRYAGPSPAPEPRKLKGPNALPLFFKFFENPPKNVA